MDENQKLRISALLSIQRALLDEVTLAMRAISAEISPNLIKIWVYHHGDLPSEVADDFDAGAITQVVADFPMPDKGDPKIEFEFVRCDVPSPIPIKGECVFAIKELR